MKTASVWMRWSSIAFAIVFAASANAQDQTVSGNLTVTGNTTTSALIASGGSLAAGVAGATPSIPMIFSIGGTNVTGPVLLEKARLTANGNLLIGGTTDITGGGGLKIFGGATSSSTTSGALQVLGGAGITGALYVGGNLVAPAGQLSVTRSSTGMVVGSRLVNGSTGASSGSGIELADASKSSYIENFNDGHFSIWSNAAVGQTGVPAETPWLTWTPANIVSFSGSLNVSSTVNAGSFQTTTNANWLNQRRDTSSNALYQFSTVGGQSWTLGLRLGDSAYHIYDDNLGADVATFAPATKATTLNGTLTVNGTGASSIAGSLGIFGTTTATNSTTGALVVGSNVGLSGNAGGASYFGGMVNAAGLNVTGPATVGGAVNAASLSVTGGGGFGGAVSVTGDLNVGGTFTAANFGGGSITGGSSGLALNAGGTNQGITLTPSGTGSTVINGSASVQNALSVGGGLTGGSSGLALASGGTNQNITLTPSGTGATILNGNVGVGTPTPSTRLQVVGSTGWISANVDNANNASVLELRGLNGKDSYLYWVETHQGDRGILGYATGSGDLVYRAGANSMSTGTEALRVTATGDVGIGVTAPTAKLDVAGAANVAGNLTVGGTFTAANFGGGSITGGTSGLALNAGGTNQNITLTPTGGNVVVASGNVGVGVTSPAAKLDVAGVVRGQGAQLTNLASAPFLGTDAAGNIVSVAAPNTTITGAQVNTALGYTPLNPAGATMVGNLTLAAGTASVAPLTLQNGTVMTTPVFGAVEFDGTNVYVTNNAASPARKTIAYAATSLSGYGITDPVVLQTGSYTNPGWLSSLDAGKLSGSIVAARLPAFSGDATSSAGTTTLTLANSGVTAGTYTKVTVDAKGRVTSGGVVSSTDISNALGYTPYNSATNSAGFITSAGVPVQSVFGRTGVVTLAASDVTGALNGVLSSPTALALTAGGTNQNVTITPSGTGYTILNGNVGIGTTTPTAPLDVVSANGETWTNGSAFWVGRSAASTLGAVVNLSKSRGSPAAPAAAIAGDQIAMFNFNGYTSGGGYSPAGRLTVEVDGTPGASAVPGRFVFATSDAAGTIAERVRIDQNGNVGIGNPAPTAKLDVTGAANVSGNLTVGGTFTAANFGGASITGTSGLALNAGGTNQNVTILPSGLGNLIVSSGNLGVGVTNPGAKLDVAGVVRNLGVQVTNLASAPFLGTDASGNIVSVAAPSTTITGSQVNTALGYVPMDPAGAVMTGNLKLAAGATTKAPLTLQSGNLLATPAFGSVEFDGTNLYVTNNSSSPTRKTVAYSASTLAGYGITDPVALTNVGYSDPGFVATLSAAKLTTGTLPTSALPAFTGGDVTSTIGSSVLTLGSPGTGVATYTKVTVDAKGRVTSGTALAAADITAALGGTLASSGGLTLTAGGTNQNITLTPSAGGATVLNGNVGVGTTTPNAKLYVKGTLGIERSNSTEFSTIDNEGNLDYNARNSYNHVWQIAGTEKMRLDTNGNLGIGTSAPQYKLHIAGNNTGNPQAPDASLDTNAWFNFGHDTGYGYIGWFTQGNGTKFVNTHTAVSPAMIKASSGTVGIYTSTATGAGADSNLTAKMVVNPTGVGIGNTNPSVALDVTGSENLTGNLTVGGTFTANNVAGATSQNITLTPNGAGTAVVMNGDAKVTSTLYASTIATSTSNTASGRRSNGYVSTLNDGASGTPQYYTIGTLDLSTVTNTSGVVEGIISVGRSYQDNPEYRFSLAYYKVTGAATVTLSTEYSTPAGALRLYRNGDVLKLIVYNDHANQAGFYYDITHRQGDNVVGAAWIQLATGNDPLNGSTAPSGFTEAIASEFVFAKNKDTGNIGIGTINPASNRLQIAKTLGTNDYTYVGQHSLQLRILNNLGVNKNRAVEMGVLDNGTAVVQANEAGVGYNYLTLNPVAGNVGIGTIAPTAGHLQVQTDTNSPGIYLAGNQPGWGSGIQFANTTPATGKTYGIYSGADGSFDFSDNAAGVNRLRFEANGSLSLQPSNGNVGIGVSTPAAPLHVQTALSEISRFESSNGAGGYQTFSQNGAPIGFVGFGGTLFGTQDSTLFGLRSQGSLTFATGGGARQMTIDSNGNVGIGTASPNANARLTIANGDNSMTLYGPNASWGSYLWTGAGTDRHASGQAQVISTNGNLHLDAGTSQHIYLGYYSVSDTYINPNGGKVGIGTTAPNATLEVNGTALIDGAFTAAAGSTFGGPSSFGGAMTFTSAGNPAAGSMSWGTTATDPLALVAGTNRSLLLASGGALSAATGLTVATTGYVGVGTATPKTKLHVVQGASGANPYESTGGFTVESGGRAIIQLLTPANQDAYLMFGNPDGANRGYIGYLGSGMATPDQMVFRTSGTFAFSGGNVGIGTTTAPSAKLEVVGDTKVTSSTTSSTTATGALVVTGGVGIAGNENVGGTLTVGTGSSSTTISPTGVATGGAVTAVTVTSSSNTNVGGSLSVTQNASFNGSTTFTNTATFGSRLQVAGSGLTMTTGTMALTSASDIVMSTPSGSERMRVKADGTIGIGTANPDANLTITNNQPGGLVPRTLLSLQGPNNTSVGWETRFVKSDENGGIPLYINTGWNGTFNNEVKFGNANSGGTFPSLQTFNTTFLATDGGQVGIARMTFDQTANVKLAVNGAIHAKEVIVDAAVQASDLKIQPQAWADAVFDQNYRNAPLSEVEENIKQQGHLPGVPSAKEVAERGVSVGQMQTVLLQKVEELTLHMIEQEKRIKRLEDENATLRAAAQK